MRKNVDGRAFAAPKRLLRLNKRNGYGRAGRAFAAPKRLLRLNKRNGYGRAGRDKPGRHAVSPLTGVGAAQCANGLGRTWM